MVENVLALRGIYEGNYPDYNVNMLGRPTVPLLIGLLTYEYVTFKRA